MRSKRFFTIGTTKFFASILLITAIAAYVSPGAAGDLDLTFNQIGYSVSAFGGGEDYGYASARQSDGKIVVAGQSSHGQTTVFSTARYNPDGSLDLGFGPGGKTHTSFGGTAYGSPGISGSWARAVAVQADGKIVLAGAVNYRNEQFGPAWSDIALVRYNTDGSLDTTFDGDGRVRTPVFANSLNAANAVAIGNDGKIVAAGRSQLGGIVVVRYNPDGSLDTTFDSDGKFTTTLGGYATDAMVQPDGKIVVTGAGFSGTSVDYVTIRLNTDGTLDASFNGTGIAPTPAVTGTHHADSLALQPDGKIIVAGQWNDPGGVALIRYNPDGTFDSSFGAGGFLNFGYFTYEGSAADLALQPDGKIVIAASVDQTPNQPDDSDFIVFRFNSNGSVDNTFNGSGSLTTSVGKGNDRVTGALVQPDGRIVVTGYLWQPGLGRDFALVRYESNGAIDQSFGNGGKVISDVGYGYGSASDLAVQNDDKIVAVGESGGFAVARYKADGTPDPAFNGTGTARAFAPDSEAKAVAVQADGKVLAAGRTRNGGTDDAAVIRYNTDGSVDQAFGGQGRIITPIGTADDILEAIAVQPDGRILTAGYARRARGGLRDLAVLRYNPDGSPDTSFDGDGRVVGASQCLHSDSTVTGVQVQGDGRIVASGECGGLAVFRFNQDGSPDTSFNKTGIAVINSPETSGYNSDVKIQNDGRIVVLGNASAAAGDSFIIARYHQDGSLDHTFNGSGIVVRSVSAAGDRATSLAIQADGKLIAAGHGRNGALYEFEVIRFKADGSADTTWGNNGVATLGFDGDGFAMAAAVDSRGRVLVGGYAAGLFGVARLQADSAPVSFASVSGRVLDANGQPVSRATVNMTDSAGAVRTAQTNPFGYYRFDGVRTGETYTFLAMAKRLRFSPRVVTIGGDLTDLDFKAGNARTLRAGVQSTLTSHYY